MDFLDRYRLDQMISAKTNEVREKMYLYQHISNPLQFSVSTPCFCTKHSPAATATIRT